MSDLCSIQSSPNATTPATSMASADRAPPGIVVVGGGAGGLELVTRLGDTLGRRGMADITLIDKSRTHLWKPLLHEVAAGSMDFAVQEIEFRAQAHWHHFHYRVGELIGLDRSKREIELAPYLDRSGREVVGRRLLRYDTLVVAIGSHGNDFGTPGVREHAILLDSADDAKRFHELLLDSFVRAQAQSEQLKPEQMNLAIIGAGATGTELAAELRTAARHLATYATYGYDRIDPERDISIHLIEAADRILPPLPKRLADESLKILDALHVDVHTSARVNEVTRSGVKLANGTLVPAELTVWAAGVKAPDVLTRLDGLETNRASQLVVLPTLQRWPAATFSSQPRAMPTNNGVGLHNRLAHPRSVRFTSPTSLVVSCHVPVRSVSAWIFSTMRLMRLLPGDDASRDHSPARLTCRPRTSRSRGFVFRTIRARQPPAPKRTSGRSWSRGGVSEGGRRKRAMERSLPPAKFSPAQ
jgi:NADH dehydrogenase FAD-containing subunit